MDKKTVEEIRETLQANQQALKDQIHQHTGQRIIDNLSQKKHQDRQDGLHNLPFHRLSDAEIGELRREVQRLAAALRTRLALRLKRAKNGNLDVKSTLRANLRYGNVPLELKHRDHAQKPKIVIICDISTSMRHVSELMLSLIYAVQDQISKTDSFAFIDHLEYISPEFHGHQAHEAVNKVLERMPSGHYNTNLGHCLETFQSDYMNKVDYRSTLIMVGDARNNYNDPRLDIFHTLARRSRSTIWLNPEAVPLWGTGDSDMLKYASRCDKVYQVSNLAQLAAAIDQLLVGG
jgi:uncharacterized protein